MSGGNLWLGALFFTCQIYGDFSGYSDIAIGSARLLGIRLSDNFLFPFFSCNVSELWRRWHRSLNQWFVDYIYIPLGGSRRGWRATARNLLIVFGLSGLWHGAAVTYVAWGLFNAGAMIFYLIWRKAISRSSVNSFRATAKSSVWSHIGHWLSIALTFALLCVGFVIFRCGSLSQAFTYFSRMFSFAPGSHPPFKYTGMLLCYIMVLLIIEFKNRHRSFGFDFAPDGLLRFKVARWGLCWIMAMATFLMAESSTGFIYFQF